MLGLSVNHFLNTHWCRVLAGPAGSKLVVCTYRDCGVLFVADPMDYDSDQDAFDEARAVSMSHVDDTKSVKPTFKEN